MFAEAQLNRRHKTILFLTLLAAGVSLILDFGVHAAAGIILVGVAFTWAFGSNIFTRRPGSVDPLVVSAEMAKPAAQSAVSVGSPVPQKEYARQQLYGVRGWLLLFCIIETIFNPVLCLFAAAAAGEAATWAIGIALGLFSFATGVITWSRRPNALRIVKAYFVTVLCVILLGITASILLASVTWAKGGPIPEVDTSGGAGIVHVVVWWRYFTRSKRVKATLGGNL